MYQTSSFETRQRIYYELCILLRQVKFKGVMILEWIESVLTIQCLITTTYFTYMAQEDKYLRMNVYFILGFY